jgi:hypothetical protein
MKLFYNPTSPYARKVIVVILEKNLLACVELCALDPWTAPAELHAANPNRQSADADHRRGRFAHCKPDDQRLLTFFSFSACQP